MLAQLRSIVELGRMNLFGIEEDGSPNLLPCDGEATYFEGVFAPDQAAQYFQKLHASVAWEHDELVIFGRRIVTQRETAWYGDQPYAYTYSHQTKVALPWTPELLNIKQQCESISGENYNSCLLNLYHDGSESMGWHSDDEDTIVPNSAIASVSFGAMRRFDFRHKTSKQKISLTLASGSLLVMAGATQRHWQHSLPKALKVKAARINLTFRQMREEV
jgi:alkylated DNA repair dioxygenase AlkB